MLAHQRTLRRWVITALVSLLDGCISAYPDAKAMEYVNLT